MNHEHMEAIGSCSICGAKLYIRGQIECDNCHELVVRVGLGLRNPDQRRWLILKILTECKQDLVEAYGRAS